MREGGGCVEEGGARAQEAEGLLGICQSVVCQSLPLTKHLCTRISYDAYMGRAFRNRFVSAAAVYLLSKLSPLHRRATSDMTTVVFSIQHAGAAKLEEIVVEVHPEWAPIGAQCVRPARAT